MKQSSDLGNSSSPDDPQISRFSIPVPSTNGLNTYSIVHHDHTLIIDVDHEGNVRRQEIINRLDQEKERIIAMITQQLLFWVKTESDELSIMIIVENQALFQLLLGIFQQLLLNIPDDIHSLLEVSRKKAILNFGTLNIYVGKWDENITSFASNNSLVIFEFSQTTIQSIKQTISNALSKNVFTSYAVLFEEEVIRKEDGREILKDLYSLGQEFQILDMSDTEKALLSIYSLLRIVTT